MTTDPMDPLGLFAVARGEEPPEIITMEQHARVIEALADCDAQRMSLAAELRATRARLRDLVDWGFGPSAPDECIRAHMEAIEFLDATPGHGGEDA